MSAAVYWLSVSSAHPVTWWLVKLGKVLLFLAGLAIVLDLVGHERLRRARDWATHRHELLVEIRTVLAHTRTIRQLAETVVGHAIVTGVHPDYAVTGYEPATGDATAVPPLLGRDDVEGFRRRARTDLTGHHGCDRSHQGEICPEQARFVELAAAREVMGRLGVSQDTQEFTMGRYQRSAGVYAVVALTFALGVSTAAACGWLLRVEHPVTVPKVLATLVVGVLALALEVVTIVLVGAPFGSRLRLHVSFYAVTVPLRTLSSWGLALLGRRAEGNPVKWLALGLFMAGSLIDVVWG